MFMNCHRLIHRYTESLMWRVHKTVGTHCSTFMISLSINIYIIRAKLDQLYGRGRRSRWVIFPACSGATCDQKACASEIYLEVLHPRKYTGLFVDARLVKQSLQKPSGGPLTERWRKRARFWQIGVFVSATRPPAPPFLPRKLGSDRLFWDKVIFVRAPGRRPRPPPAPSPLQGGTTTRRRASRMRQRQGAWPGGQSSRL